MKNFAKLALLGVAASACLCAEDQVAWEKKTIDQCKKEASSKDESSFEGALTPHAKRQYRDLTDVQRKKAMDYADKNKMTPDEAVAKVASEK